MVKVVCGKSRIGEASYRGEGKGQIVVGEIELGKASWTRMYEYVYILLCHKVLYVGLILTKILLQAA